MNEDSEPKDDGARDADAELKAQVIREFDAAEKDLFPDANAPSPAVILEAFAGLEPGFILSHQQIFCLSEDQATTIMRFVRERLSSLIASPEFQACLAQLPIGTADVAHSPVCWEDMHALEWTMRTMEDPPLTHEQIRKNLPPWMIGGLATEARRAIADTCSAMGVNCYSKHGDNNPIGAFLQANQEGDRKQNRRRSTSDDYSHGPINPERDLPPGTLRLITDPAELPSLEEVIGLEEQLQRLLPSVLRLIYPDVVTTSTQHVLLTGPHGTGKSLLAGAVARSVLERNPTITKPIKFVQVNLSDVFWKWVGESNANTNRLLKFLEENAPVIAFMDEIDAGIADSSHAQMHAEDLRVQNTFLQWLSGLTQRRDILIIGATNQPNRISAGFLRSGRFGKGIEVPHPSLDALCAMAERRLSKFHSEQSIDLTQVRCLLQAHVFGTCAEPDAFTGADIDAWMTNIEDQLLMKIHQSGGLGTMPSIDDALVAHSYQLLLKDRSARRAKLAGSDEGHTCDINSPFGQLFRLMEQLSRKESSGVS